MRILFLHTAREKAFEYDVHRMLADTADPVAMECHFIWQHSAQAVARSAERGDSNRDIYYDFGRDMSLYPQPTKLQRARLMVRQAPGGFKLIARKIKRIRPDVIYTSQQWVDFYVASAMSRAFRIPHVTHIHYPIGPWLRYGVDKVLVRSHRLIAVSEFIRTEAIQLGTPPAHIQTVYNPADLRLFDVPHERSTIRREFGWPESTPLIVSAGRLDPSKGHMALIEAFARIAPQMPALRLLICGAATTVDNHDLALKQRVAALGLDNQIIFAGIRHDMPTIMSNADIFCLPTEREAFGLVFVEAMAAGVPVVACQSGAVPEIVQHGETGLLSPVGDIDRLRDHLLLLLRNPHIAAEMGQKGHARAITQFAPNLISKRWSDVVHAMVAHDTTWNDIDVAAHEKEEVR